MRIVVHIAKNNILAIPNAKAYFFRHKSTDNTIHPYVYHLDILTARHLRHMAIYPFTAFFFKLKSINLPIGYIMKTGFGTHVVFQGHGIDASRCLRLTDIQSGSSIRTCRPDILKSTTPIVGHPQTPILVVPSKVPTGFHNGRGRRTDTAFTTPVRLLARSTRNGFPQGAVTSYKLNIIQIRAFTRHPLTTHSTVVVCTGAYTYTIQDIITAFRRLYQRNGSTETTECRLTFF